MRSTMPTEANQDSEELGLLIDRAFVQTIERGGTYAVVPAPWLNCWADTGYTMGIEFSWPTRCWYARPILSEVNLTLVEQDGDGNYLVCLLDVGHDGECGHKFLT